MAESKADGINVFGSQFKVEVNFEGAQTGADKLDASFQNMPRQAQLAVDGMIAQLDRLETRFNSLAGKAATIFGAAGEGQGAGGRSGGSNAYLTGVANNMIHPPNERKGRQASQSTPASIPRLGDGGPVAPYTPDWARIGYGTRPSHGQNWVPYQPPPTATRWGGRPPPDPPPRNIGGLVPFTGDPGLDWRYLSNDLTRYAPPPQQPRIAGLLPGPTMGYATVGQWRPQPNYAFRTIQNVAGAADRTVGGMRGIARGASMNNLLRAASGIYVGQTLGRAVAGMANMTIGAASDEQEGRVLLAESLAGGNIGLTRDEGRLLANSLVERRYLTGTDSLSAVSLGLSRAQLADTYRQLSPIVRLHAEDENMFAEGLQRGSLARQLLVARDPVQGTRGAMVALSELYAGGPDRFRSLAMRFELPRTRMMELEEGYIAKGGMYDPALILLDVLEEMGIGPEYVKTRAQQTLPGQLARSGALVSNARIDMFQDSLGVTIGNIRRLNDAVEMWTNSDAYDKSIAWVDDFFGRVTNFMTSPLTNYFAGAAIDAIDASGGHSTRRTAISALDMMQSAGRDGFWSLSQRDEKGNRSLLTAAEAFGEAAAAALEERFRTTAGAPVYNPATGLMTGAATNMMYGLAGGAILNRALFGGQGGAALSTILRPSGLSMGMRMGAAGARLATGFMATGLPLALLAGGSLAVARGQESAKHYGRMGSIDGDFLADYLAASGADPIQVRRLAGQQRAASSSNGFRRTMGGLITGLQDLNLFSPGPLIDLETGRFGPSDQELSADALKIYNTARVLADWVALDPTMASLEGAELAAAMADRLDFLAQPDQLGDKIGTTGQRAAAVQYVTRQLADPLARERMTLEAGVYGLLTQQARRGFGYDFDTPDGGMISLAESDAAKFLDNEMLGSGLTPQQLVDSIVDAFLGNSDELFALLGEAIGYLRDGASNTGDMASVMMKRVKLSEAPGLFYGYDPDADYRNVGIAPGSYKNPHGGGGVTPGGGGALPGAATTGSFGATRQTSYPGEVYGTDVPGSLTGHRHKGIDLAFGDPGAGDPIYSFFNDAVQVIENRWSESLGHKLQVMTASGEFYDLGHFDSKPEWAVGQYINPGDLMGIEGMTGLASGAHLHLALAGNDLRNYDEAEFMATLVPDLSPGADFAAGHGDGGTHVEVHVHVDKTNASADDIAEAVGREIHRATRDGLFTYALNQSAYQSARQGRSTRTDNVLMEER